MLGVGSLVGVPITERIPESSKLAGNDVPIQSVIVNRKQVKQPPSNGSTFVPNQVVSFVLSSGQDFMIPSSASLHYKIVNTDTSANKSCIDDLATAVFNRSSLSLSGVQLEQTLDVNKAINTLVYAHMNSAHYEREATINAKAWKWAKGLYTNGVATGGASADYERLDSTGVASRQLARATEETASGASGVEVNIPLSYIFALFRSNKLFPLSFVSDLRIDLNTESAIKAMFRSDAVGTPNYSITDVYITYDAVSLSSDYLRVLTASFSAGADMGYTLPVNVITTSQTSTTATGEVDITFSKSTPFLKAVYFRQAPTAFDSAVNDYSISGQSYCLDTNPMVQLRIGTQPFPEYAPLQSAEEVYRNNQIHLSHYSNVLDNLGLAQHKNNWALPVSASGDNSVFYILFGFEKLAGLGADYYAMDSYDASVSGGVMTLHCDLAVSNVQTLAIFEHTRLVQFGDRRVDVRA